MLNTRIWLRGSASLAAVLGTAAFALPAGAQVAEPAPPTAVTTTQQAPASRFDVRAIQVKGNRFLPADAVEEIVYPFMGPDRTPDDIEQARAALQKAFEQRGFATVSVFIPEQSVDSGIIRLEVQSQTIGNVEIAGARRTSREWVMARAPSLQPGGTPNFTQLQNDIVALNQSADRKVTPEVRAGTAPGTVDVVLNVEDRTPFQSSAELNNFSSGATTELRASGTLRYDDLWGRGDSISISAQLAPQRPKDGTVLSANYLTRVGDVQLLGYFVHSDSDIAVIGGTSVIGKGDIGGVRVILPLGQGENFHHSLTIGADYKNFQEDVTLGADRDSAPIEYMPFSLAWRGDWTGNRVKSDASITGVFGFRGLFDGPEAFVYKRFGASPSFFVLKADASATIDGWRDFQFYLRGTGQWSADPLISNEGFSLGGMESVRGYFESEALGDIGFAFQSELRSPPLAPLAGSFLDELRVHAFLDWGKAAIRLPLASQEGSWRFASLGAGTRIRLFKYFNGAADVGVPLLDGPDSASGEVFVRFRIWGEF
jgi:hemolysin activation/secretion protein